MPAYGKKIPENFDVVVHEQHPGITGIEFHDFNQAAGKAAGASGIHVRVNRDVFRI